MPHRSFLFLLFLSGCHWLSAQNINNAFRSKLTFPGQTLANVWGYAANGREYALLGAAQGMIVVDITNPDAPQQIVQIPGPNNLWKEIKTYQHYAYIVSEGGMGLQIVNLSNLPSPTLSYKSYYGNGAIANQLNKGHALHVDTAKGFVYIYGSNLIGGGPIVLNLQPDPYNPVYAGQFGQLGYVHDGYADNDTMFSSHIYAGQFAVVDMRNKSAPQLLATQTTPGAFTHNTWLTPDRKTILATDEVNNSVLSAYDVSDLTDIRLLDQIQSNPGSNSIVHNTHILDHYAVTSWYRDGYTIVDITRPDNLVQVGNYDTYAGGGSGFQGCWGVYPYFPSGTIIASNISAPGSNNNGELYVLTPTYVRACYLEGDVRDAVTGLPLNNAQIKILNSAPLTQESSNAQGIFKMGQLQAGNYQVEISRPGYQTLTAPALLEHGEVFFLHAALFPQGSLNVGGRVVLEGTDTPVGNATVMLYGLELVYSATSDPAGQFNFTGVAPGMYDLSATAPPHGMTMQYRNLIVQDTSGFLLELKKGFRRPELSESPEAPDQAFSASPNPFSGQIELRIGAPAAGTIRLTDLQGRLLAEYPVEAQTQTLRVQPELPAGMYLLQLVQEGQVSRAFRVVKK
jgi:choice-of-anchor B domain-containing protein